MVPGASLEHEVIVASEPPPWRTYERSVALRANGLSTAYIIPPMSGAYSASWPKV
jgi:hypothetical protein